VDNSGDVGENNSLALNTFDIPRIAYFDRTRLDLRFASRDAGVWSTVLVDSTGNTGWDPSLALDSSGRACIAYYSVTGFVMRYAREGAGWVSEPVYYQGQTPALALDAADRPHIAHRKDFNSGVRYTSKTSNGWASDTLVVAGLDFVRAQVIDTQGTPYVLYWGSHNHLAHRVGSTWIDESVPGGDQLAALVVDALGRPHLFYRPNSLGGPVPLFHAWKVDGVWQQEEVIHAVDYYYHGVAAAVGPDGSLHVAAHSYPQSGLLYARQVDVTASPGSPHGPAVTLDLAAPNPSNPSTKVRFTLAAAGPVRVVVFNTRGQRVRAVLAATLGAGPQVVEWDGRDEAGGLVSSGVYFVRLEAAAQVLQRAVTLVR
jgi:hypothetical protein